MRYVRFLCAVIAAGLLAACALQPIPYDRTSSGEIKTIGIITPAMPSRPAVVLASSVGQSFGLIGGLIDAGMQENRETKFKTVIEPHNFSATDACLQELTARLQEQGYTVVSVPVQRTKHGFEDKYPVESEPKVDAYLDLVVSYGYITAGVGSTPYRPIVYMTARLVRATDATVLMQDAVSYNAIGPYGANKKAITLAPDPTYQFPNFDKLVGDPATAVKGMQVSLERSASTLGQLLK
jgi:hypothetical protein